MKRIKFLFFVVVLVGFAALAHAGFDEGKAAYDRGDYTVAYKEFKPLAEQGNAKAQGYLGVMYDNGQGMPQDFVLAHMWARKAAEQGIAGAQWFMGMMYEYGNGMPKDHAEALKWLRKAAEQGVAGGQLFLGMMYYEGDGVPQDFVLAHMWLNLAAAQGESNAKKLRDLLAKKMTPAQIAEAQRLAREWKPKGKD